MLVLCKKDFVRDKDEEIKFEIGKEYIFEIKDGLLVYCDRSNNDRPLSYYQISINQLKEYFTLVIF